MHQVPRFENGRTRHPGFQSRVHFDQRRLGQKSERTKVHRKNGRIGQCKGSRRSQQRAVPAQHDNQVRCMVRHVRTVYNRIGIQVVCALDIQDVREPALSQPLRQVGEHLLELRLLRLRDDSGLGHAV